MAFLSFLDRSHTVAKPGFSDGWCRRPHCAYIYASARLTRSAYSAQYKTALFLAVTFILQPGRKRMSKRMVIGMVLEISALQW